MSKESKLKQLETCVHIIFNASTDERVSFDFQVPALHDRLTIGILKTNCKTTEQYVIYTRGWRKVLVITKKLCADFYEILPA